MRVVLVAQDEGASPCGETIQNNIRVMSSYNWILELKVNSCQMTLIIAYRPGVDCYILVGSAFRSWTFGLLMQHSSRRT